MKNIIVAYDCQRAIGVNGGLLWQQGTQRGDMKHFKELTTGSVIIMGRKTFDSIGLALPGRKTIVCSRKETDRIADIETASSLNEAYRLARSDNNVFIVGGGEIYQQALKDADRIYATEVDALFDGADTFFPNLGPNWKITAELDFPADKNNLYPYRFVTYERK